MPLACGYAGVVWGMGCRKTFIFVVLVIPSDFPHGSRLTHYRFHMVTDIPMMNEMGFSHHCPSWRCPAYVVGLPRNGDILTVEYLRQRRYTSGDAEACIGVSRKVLLIVGTGGASWISFYQGLGSGRGDERFRKNGGSSMFDIWNLAFYTPSGRGDRYCGCEA